MPIQKETTEFLSKELYLTIGDVKYRKCPVCNGPIENMSYPHFHVVEGKIVKSEEAWNEKQSNLIKKLWSL